MHAARSTRRFTLLSAAALLAACGSEVQTAAPVAAAGPVQLAGTYQVRGSTRVVGAAETREIEGTVILAQEGDAYTATFNLQTLYPAEGGPVTAEVIGRGDGTIAGRSLEGSARTQILASRVQGLATGSAIFATGPVVRHGEAVRLLAQGGVAPVARDQALPGIVNPVTVYEIP